MKDIGELLLAAAAVSLLLLALVLLFFLPIVALPTALVGAGVYYWWHHPNRAEAVAKEHTHALYQALSAPPPVDDSRLLRLLPPDVPEREQVLAMARAIYAFEKIDHLPAPPAICNSIEGARYRDTLNRLAGATAEDRAALIDRIALIVAITVRENPREAHVGDILTIVMSGPPLFARHAEVIAPRLSDEPPEPSVFADTPIADLFAIPQEPQPVVVPDQLRTQHMHVIAATGFGKSQLFQSMILDDLATRAAIVVIDSQSDLISTIATRVPAERLILIDPETCPPALNVFAGKPEDTATAVELLEYAFSALDAGLTSRQSMVYRYLCRLLFAIPGASIHTLRELLEPDGTQPYQRYIDGLGDTARSFFAEYQRPRNNQYAETRQEVLRRLFTVLENDTFAQMLGAERMAIDMAAALDAGKVVLVSTAKRHLRQTGASLFGRLFISQVMQAVMARQGSRRRTYLYLDEFQDYAEDSPVLFNLFEQGRKYDLGMVCAHQSLSQLPEKLRASMATNTAIKFAGGVSAEDRANLARQMECEPAFIASANRGTFAAWFRDKGTTYFPVTFGRLEQQPEFDRLPDIQARMRDQFGPKPRQPPPQAAPQQPEEPSKVADVPDAARPPGGRGDEVDEIGKWG